MSTKHGETMNDPRDRLRAQMDENREWFRIQNKANDKTRIDLMDEIGFFGVSANDFIAQLNDVEAKEIQLHINSPGGAVWDGIAIYNALKDHDAKIVVTVDGIAASAASFIAQAGEEIVMNRNSEMMVHEANGFAIGNAQDMADMAQMLNRMSDNIASIYAERAGGTTEDWRDVMTDETWYTAQEAVDAGLADRVATAKPTKKSEEAKARFDLSVFAHAGRSDAPPPPIVNKHEKPRVSITANDPEVSSMTPEQLQKLNLPEDASQEQIDGAPDALLAAKEATPETPVTPATETIETPATAPEVDAPQAKAATLNIPEGLVLIEEGRLQTLENSAKRTDAFLEQERIRTRDALITNAIGEGKITPAFKQDWLDRYDVNAQETTAIIASLKPVVPTKEIGHSGDEVVNISEDEAYPAEWSSSLTPRKATI